MSSIVFRGTASFTLYVGTEQYHDGTHYFGVFSIRMVMKGEY